MTPYWPRRPDLADVVCGLTTGSRRNFTGAGWETETAPDAATLRLFEKSGMDFDPFFFMRRSRDEYVSEAPYISIAKKASPQDELSANVIP